MAFFFPLHTGLLSYTHSRTHRAPFSTFFPRPLFQESHFFIFFFPPPLFIIPFPLFIFQCIYDFSFFLYLMLSSVCSHALFEHHHNMFLKSFFFCFKHKRLFFSLFSIFHIISIQFFQKALFSILTQNHFFFFFVLRKPIQIPFYFFLLLFSIGVIDCFSFSFPFFSFSFSIISFKRSLCCLREKQREK